MLEVDLGLTRKLLNYYVIKATAGLGLEDFVTFKVTGNGNHTS